MMEAQSTKAKLPRWLDRLSSNLRSCLPAKKEQKWAQEFEIATAQPVDFRAVKLKYLMTILEHAQWTVKKFENRNHKGKLSDEMTACWLAARAVIDAIRFGRAIEEKDKLLRMASVALFAMGEEEGWSRSPETSREGHSRRCLENACKSLARATYDALMAACEPDDSLFSTDVIFATEGAAECEENFIVAHWGPGPSNCTCSQAAHSVAQEKYASELLEIIYEMRKRNSFEKSDGKVSSIS